MTTWVHRLPLRVDRPAEVVDRLPVGGPKRKARAVDPRQPGRMRAGAGRIDVAAEVERLGLLRPQRRGHDAGPTDGEEELAGPREEPPARAALGDRFAKHSQGGSRGPGGSRVG